MKRRKIYLENNSRRKFPEESIICEWLIGRGIEGLYSFSTIDHVIHPAFHKGQLAHPRRAPNNRLAGFTHTHTRIIYKFPCTLHICAKNIQYSRDDFHVRTELYPCVYIHSRTRAYIYNIFYIKRFSRFEKFPTRYACLHSLNTSSQRLCRRKKCLYFALIISPIIKYLLSL